VFDPVSVRAFVKRPRWRVVANEEASVTLVQCLIDLEVESRLPQEKEKQWETRDPMPTECHRPPT
jgi:hypothetical protein